MTPDQFDHIAPPGRRPGRGTRGLLFAGVASACVLGVGMGLWARPGPSERRLAATAALTGAALQAAPARTLKIVLDDRPAPARTRIEVLPGAPAKLQPPKGPPEGLTRVQAVASPTPAPLAVAARAEAQSARLAAAAKASAQALRKTQLAMAAAARAQAHRVELARAEAARAAAARASRLARAEAAKAAAHRVELARAAKAAATAARAEQLRLARAEARGRAEARAEAKAQALAQARTDARRHAQLAALTRARRKVVPHQPPPVQLARFDRRAKVHEHERVERAALRRKPSGAAQPAYHAHPAPLPHPGLMRVSAPGCASRDRGAALVCADPSLGAAERQLARAYQGARAAGVPEAQLQRQQQRWLAARSAAAREAPWAVHDVYVARIAELNGQAHDARRDGY